MSRGLTWCREMLLRVSRTFTLRVQARPAPLEPRVTAAFLRCRVVIAEELKRVERLLMDDMAIAAPTLSTAA